jgi:hypothetical protein
MTKSDFIFEDTCFGFYNQENKTAYCCLNNYFVNGRHRKKINDPIYPEDNMIEDIIYTLNHETIHAVHDQVEGINDARETECIVYNMLGNGGNLFFHAFYGIQINTKWEKILNV